MTEEPSLENGDTVAIRSNNRCATVCVVLRDGGCDSERLQMKHVVRYNICVQVGDEVLVTYDQIYVRNEVLIQPTDMGTSSEIQIQNCIES